MNLSRTLNSEPEPSIQEQLDQETVERRRIENDLRRFELLKRRTFLLVFVVACTVCLFLGSTGRGSISAVGPGAAVIAYVARGLRPP